MKAGFVTLAAAALVSAFSFAAPAAAAIDKHVTINVYQVCNSAGTDCAAMGPAGNEYFAAETNEIWAQAGVSVSFNFVSQLLYDDVYDLDDRSFLTSFNRLSLAGGGANPTTVSLYLVNSINAYQGGVTYGEAYQDAGGFAVAMGQVMSFNGGVGRSDTVAHEFGHNLGLVPASLGGDAGGHSSTFYELMSSGAVRCVPGAPCGGTVPENLRLDYLTGDQIALARQSGLLQNVSPVPEPGEWAMLVAGLGVVGFVGRRRAA